MNVADINKTIEIFTSDIENPIIEIRMLKTKKSTISGYYDKEGFLNIARDIKRYNGCNNIYFVINELKKELIARGVNKLREYADATTKDDDILKRRWILIDFDPIRVAGICATNEEKEKAYELAIECKKKLKDAGFTEPLFMDSGNGYHLFYKIDMENNKEKTSILKKLLSKLGDELDNEFVNVDKSVFNASRITKLYGTTAVKGDSTEERPHRLSKILEVPNEIQSVSNDIVEKFVNFKKEQKIKRSIISDSFDIEDWLHKNNIGISNVKNESNKTTYVLERCPFNREHKSPDAAVFKFSDGVGFKCQHDSCSSYHWKDFRVHYEPDCYSKETYKSNKSIKPNCDKKNTSGEKETKIEVIKVVDEEIEAEETIFNTNYCIYRKNIKKYMPKTMMVNVESLLEHLGITIKYNEMSKEIDYEIKELKDVSQDNLQNVCLEYITDKCVEYDFQSFNPNRLSSIILSIADKNKYHPVRDYILSQYDKYKDNCDGTVKELCNVIKTPMTFDSDFKNNLIETWLISCVKSVFDKTGVKSEGCIVLQGEQGKFKTTFLKALSPKPEWFKDGQELNPSDKDVTLQSIKYWIVELGELETTFKRDLGKLKAFISKDYDEFRRSYARTESKYPRRTIFCASVNEVEFLKDATGNRRWWVIPVTDIDINEQKKINVNKLWVEVYKKYLAGGKHYLDKKEEAQLAESNKSFNEKNYVDTLIESFFNWDASNRYWMTTSDVFKLIGSPTNISLTRINQSLKKMGIESGVGRKRRMKRMPKTNYPGANWSYEAATF